MSKFEPGNVVRFKNGPQTELLWGDKVELHYFLVSEDQEQERLDGYVRVYSHPYRFALHQDELELVARDEFEEFPDDFAPGWDWWNSLDEIDQDSITPCWLEFLGR